MYLCYSFNDIHLKDQDMIDNKLYEYMAELLKRTPLDFIRYKYDEINWNGRLIGIMGPRGVGKPP